MTVNKNNFSVNDIDSKKHFYSIGEVSKIIDEDQHVIRFWEKKFSVIDPVRKSGNRRYYRKEDIELLLKIKELLRDKGVTIRGLQKLFKHKSKSVILADASPNLELFIRREEVGGAGASTEKKTSSAAGAAKLAELTEELTDLNNQIAQLLAKYNNKESK